MPSVRMNPVSMILFAALVPHTTACELSATPVERGQVRVTITAADGAVEERTGSWEELVAPALRGLGAFRADGRDSADPGEVFSAGRTELTLFDGEALVLERSARSLRRTAPALAVEAAAAAAVDWNEELDTLWIAGDDGVTVVQVEGVADPDARARYLGTMAVMMLGGHLGLAGLSEEARGGPAVMIALAVIGITSHAACVWYGPQRCGEQASLGCGAGNVRDFKTICGVGTDVNGSWQFGYHCSFSCR
jgi:hypothetical protein